MEAFRKQLDNAIREAAASEVLESDRILYDDMLKRMDAGFSGVEKSYLQVAMALYTINEKLLFRIDGYKNITDFGYDRYDMKKSQIYNYVNVIFRFGDVKDGICTRLKKDYRSFTISQLIRMLDVPENYVKEFTPDMTIKDIIAKKNRLKETIILQRSEAVQQELDFPDPVPDPVSDKALEADLLSGACLSGGMDAPADVCVEDDDILIGSFTDPAESGSYLLPMAELLEKLQEDVDFKHRRYHFEIRLCWE